MSSQKLTKKKVNKTVHECAEPLTAFHVIAPTQTQSQSQSLSQQGALAQWEFVEDCIEIDFSHLDPGRSTASIADLVDVDSSLVIRASFRSRKNSANSRPRTVSVHTVVDESESAPLTLHSNSRTTITVEDWCGDEGFCATALQSTASRSSVKRRGMVRMLNTSSQSSGPSRRSGCKYSAASSVTSMITADSIEDIASAAALSVAERNFALSVKDEVIDCE